ncbi:MAG TPA: hypothetical protein PK156_21135, partial [Polyangium sp.]|nr:hypothetical protein [Polyangium sp.]
SGPTHRANSQFDPVQLTGSPLDLDCLVDALWAHISASEAAMGALTHDCAISAPSLIWWTSASVSLETHAGSEVRKVKQINNRANHAKNRLRIAG